MDVDPGAIGFDYQHLSALVADKLTESMADVVAERVAAQVAEVVASEVNAGRQHHPRDWQQRERCRLVQNVITSILKEGAGVSKLEDFGSDREPGALDLDADDEGAWNVDWEKGAKHASNRMITDHWVNEVMESSDMKRLHKRGKITDEQFTHDFVQSLLPFTFGAVRKCIKINQDKSGARAQKLKASKLKSKLKEHQRTLVAHRRQIAQERTWKGKPIPEEFFDPAYHSEFESDPTPDLRTMYEPIPMAEYKRLRNGAKFEMLTPGWRSDDITQLFHWLTQEYRKSKGDRPEFSRYYYPVTRRFDIEDMPDGVPRCMIKNTVFETRMDNMKQELVGIDPEGW